MGFKETIKDWWSGAAAFTDLPPHCRLDFAVRDLIRFYAVDSKNLIDDYTEYKSAFEKYKARKADIAELQQHADAYQKLRSLFQDTSSGALGIMDIMAEIEENCAEFVGHDISSLVTVKFEKSAGSIVNASASVDKFGVMDQCGAMVETNLKETELEQGQGLEERRTAVTGGNVTEAPPDAIDNPYLSAIMLNSPRLCPANSRSLAGSIFFNSIPTHEMSQCTPYINIDFVSETNYITNGGRLMSLFGFTGGGTTQKSTATGVDLTSLTAVRDLGSWWESIASKAIAGTAENPITGLDETFSVDRRNISASGIELFQSPQTLNQVGGSTGLNPTVPIASLTRLTVDVSGLGLSTLCNKTASIEFILHDRSQLKLISPIVGASTFASTYLNIEFGWSHPQATKTNSNNVYANFLNSLRSKSSFNIQMAETTMLEDGQVRVSLKLASRGVTELISLPAACGVTHVPGYVLQPFLGPLIEQIADNTRGYEGIIKSAEEGLAEGDISNLQALNETRLQEIQTGYSSLSSMTGPTAQISIERYRELLNKIRPRKTDGESLPPSREAIEAGIEIIREIYELTEDDPKGTSTLGMQLTEKALLLQSIDIFEDSFRTIGAADEASQALRAQTQAAVLALAEQVNPANVARVTELFEKANQARAIEDTNKGSENPSLGAAMLSFVGRPLQAIGKYDEVQMIFYPFNSQAGKMADINIARFPLIGFGDFITKIDVENPRISCTSFAEQLFGDVCGPENPGHPNYWMSDLYKKVSPEDLSSLSDEAKAERRKKFQKDKAARLKQIYSTKGSNRQAVFNIPDLNIFVECLPLRSRGEGVKGDQMVKQCVRIHVYDAKAGVPVEAELLQAMITAGTACIVVDGETEADGDFGGPSEAEEAVAAKDAHALGGEQVIEDLLENSLIEKRTAPDDDGLADQLIFVNNSPAKAIKDSIKSIYPHIEFGGQYTNIRSIGMSSNTGGATGQVLLLNAIEGSRSNPGNSAQPSAGLDDIFIVPTSATITSAGFPNVRYAEKYYIDMGTGTTADNFYYVTGIRHTLTPGNFETSLTMTYNGSATNKSLMNTMQSIANAGD